ncbi:MAG TPA: SagB family peptide dehydrogenase [Xanthobacteraceae bacterium]|jgi:SagB-type dehydrogenase family enzyme
MGDGAVRAPKKTQGKRAQTPDLFVRLAAHVTLEVQPGGQVLASFHDYSIGLGTFDTSLAARLPALRAGLPLSAVTRGGRRTDQGIDVLVRRLARRNLVEYALRRAGGADLIAIEPQTADFWPQVVPLRSSDALALSRFAYLRRRGNDMVLESPRSTALLRIDDPRIAGLLAKLSTPQPVGQLRREQGFPGLVFLGLLVDCQFAFKVDAKSNKSLRSAEGDGDLVVWDFHDLLFHTRSTEGRHANPLGGTYPHAGMIAPLPAVRPSWPGKKIELREVLAAQTRKNSPIAEILRERHSVRNFDERRPITLAELSQFLDGAARIVPKPEDVAAAAGEDEYAPRPYPSAGAAYELELYLCVNSCEGLPRGFYYYDAERHALAAIDVAGNALDASLVAAGSAMGVEAPPQILITIAARFGRISWKYSSLAYSLILRDAGVLLQTFYLMAADLDLGGCAVGIANIDLFAKMTGIEFHVEGPVGQFALGRGA